MFRSLIFLFVGGVFLLIGLVAGAMSVQLERAWAQAEGEVVSVNAGAAHVNVRFVTAAGETIEYPQSGMISQEVGDRVPVLYQPDDPNDAVMASFGALYGFPVVQGVLGGFLLVLGAREMSMARRASGPKA